LESGFNYPPEVGKFGRFAPDGCYLGQELAHLLLQAQFPLGKQNESQGGFNSFGNMLQENSLGLSEARGLPSGKGQ
jgi:hypothetical protein